MDSAILFIQMPDASKPEGRQQWQIALRSIEDAKKLHPEVEPLGENCWLIPFDNGASALAAFVTAAGTHKFGHRILFFEQPPQWVNT